MTKSKKPELGKHYDRNEIYEMYGGNKQSALPFKDGVPVCGCYDPKMNPNAPEEILVGVGELKEHYSRIAAEQNLILPIFLKRASHAIGHWFKSSSRHQYPKKRGVS